MEEFEDVQEVKVKGKPGRKPKAAAPASSDDMVKLLLEQFERMSKESQGNVERVAMELRKPTMLEQKKLDEEHAQLLKRAEMSVAVARQKEATEQAVQAACKHQDDNQDNTFWGQVNSGTGMVSPFCSRCGLKTTPFKASADQITQGVMLRKWKKNLTAHELNEYAKYANQSH